MASTSETVRAVGGSRTSVSMSPALLSDPLLPSDPSRLHQYTLLGRLPGQHASEVFLAEHNDTVHVLKMGPAPADTDDSGEDRFARELRNARRVRSPRVAQVLDSGEWHGRPYLVQEHVEGPTLAELLVERLGRPLDDGDLARLATGLAEALVDLDKARVVHRDLTPNNVIVHPVRGAVLVDFGISRAEHDPRRTKQGFAVGTPGYMSPEQLRGESPTHAGDVFQWGLVVGQAMLGRHPIVGVMDSDEGLDDGWVNALSAAVVDRGLRGRLGRLVEQALAVTPEERPSAHVILRDVDRTSLLPAATASLAIPYVPRRLRDARAVDEVWALSRGIRVRSADLVAETWWAFAVLLLAALLVGWSAGWLAAVLVAGVSA